MDEPWDFHAALAGYPPRSLKQLTFDLSWGCRRAHGQRIAGLKPEIGGRGCRSAEPGSVGRARVQICDRDFPSNWELQGKCSSPDHGATSSEYYTQQNLSEATLAR